MSPPSTDDDVPHPGQPGPSQPPPQRTVVLVDGSSYLYRAFHAMPDLRAVPDDPASAPTGAIRGMVNMLLSLRRDQPADYAACVFNASGPTFRDALFPAYKAQRAPMPDALRQQIAPIHEVVGLLGWPVLEVSGVEADDVIGTLARTAAEQGLTVIISSGDKDLAQLVNGRISIIDTMSGKRRDQAGVLAEFGVPAERMLDFQTLVGDAVDNVPGVDKVGPKTAAKWLREYGSLDALLGRADEIKGVAGENLRRARDWLATARQLLTIRTDCDLDGHVPGLPALDALRLRDPDDQALQEFFRRYGFKSLSARSAPAGGVALTSGASRPPGRAAGASPSVGQPADADADPDADDAPGAAPPRGLRYDTIVDWPLFEAWLARIDAAELTAIDTETTVLDPMSAQIVGISLSVTPGEAAYIPLGHTGPDAPQQLPREQVLARLAPWLENPAKAKLAQHAKYDQHVFANHGIALRGLAHDTMLQSYVLEVHRPHGLESLALRHTGRRGLSYEDVCGKGAHQIPFDQVDVERAARYACEDSDLTLHVHQVLWPRLQADAGLRVIYELEMRCSEVLFRMERRGVLVDAGLLSAHSHELGQRIVALEQRAHELAGQPFNLGSPKQIGDIFFGKLGLPVVKKTATGAPSTDEEVLEKLALDYPLPATILEHRSLSKLKGTYTDKLAQQVRASTGRVHTHYAQAVAVTGRLSSNDPNLQNIPIRTPEGRRIREAFVAPPGWFIASADYSQIELRIMAHLSQDPALLRAFHAGEDVHRATAAEVFGLAPQAVSAEQRRYAKVINFGLIYGMSSFGLARNLGIEVSAAKNYIDRYFERFAGVRRYMDTTREQARAQGFVQTVFGRRLVLPEINSPNGPRRAAAERAAINAPMQGTAADLIKMAMVRVQAVLDEQRRATRMLLQVHDELVFETPPEEVDWLREQLPPLMAGVAQLAVPLAASVGVGRNWDEAH